MTRKDYAQVVTDLYNDLQRRHFYEQDIFHLIDLYFTSGAYKNEPHNHEEE